MALTTKGMLVAGEPFPNLRFNLLAGKEVLRVQFPGNSGGKWTVFLRYCSSSCSRCREQLIHLQKMIGDSAAGNVRAVAASCEDLERAVKTAWDLHISFPVAYGIDIEAIKSLYGKRQPNTCPTGFLIDPKGKIAASFEGSTQFAVDWLHTLDSYRS